MPLDVKAQHVMKAISTRQIHKYANNTQIHKQEMHKYTKGSTPLKAIPTDRSHLPSADPAYKVTHLSHQGSPGRSLNIAPPIL